MTIDFTPTKTSHLAILAADIVRAGGAPMAMEDVVSAMAGYGFSGLEADRGIRLAEARGLVAYDAADRLVSIGVLALFRVVTYVPDPFIGSRVPIAALVSASGSVVVLPATRLPCAACLGGESALELVRDVLATLARGTAFDRLPSSVGPQVALGDVYEVPDATAPVSWVRGGLCL